MAETADVVVIGGGVTGASVAFHLATAGVRDVVIVERGVLGSGSTARAMGGVRAQFADPLHIRMSLFSIDVFERFEALTGRSSGYLPHGYLLLATRPEHVARLAEVAKLQRAGGLEDVVMIPPDEVARRLPFLDTSDVRGAAFRQGDGFDDSIDPAYADRALAWARRRAPGLGDMVPDRGRCSAGLYAMTPDHHAVPGEDPDLPGLLQANGCSGHGVMHSPATGRILADLITTGRCEAFPKVERLGPSRFRAGALLTEPTVF